MRYQSHLQCIGAVFGGTAIELAGRVIDPIYQARGIGSHMLRSYISDDDATFITTYTRNPSVLGMISTVADTIYPMHRDDELEAVAKSMPNAVVPKNGVVYHYNRYGDDGLYVGKDPADRPYPQIDMALKDVFTGLRHPGNALIVAARVMQSVVKTQLDGATDITELRV